MLELSSIQFSYTRKGPLVLNDCSLSISKAGPYLVLGKNGSGKSTLMDVITGFKQPRQGRVLINGVDINSNNKSLHELRRLVSYMPASLRFPEHLYVDGLLDLYSGPYHSKELSGELGLDRFMNNKYSELSDGFKTRLALSICLSRGAYVLLDEPLKSQDEELKRIFPSLLNKYSVGRTVLICSPQDIVDVKWQASFFLENGGLRPC